MSERHRPEVVVVVGASSGIGAACAIRFAERGADLVLAARSAPALERVAERCLEVGAASVLVVATDVCDEDAVGRLIDASTRSFDAVDTLVHSVGVMAYGTVEDVPSAVFRQVVDTSVHGTANVARAVLPVFRAQQHGTMVVVTSLLGSVPVPGMGAYITGKWGQLGLARILQLETRDADRINICTVAPGAVDTPIYRVAANYIGRRGQPPPPVSDPDRIADAVLACVDRPRRNLSVGWANHVVTLGFRALPFLYDALVTPLFDRGALAPASVPPGDGNVFAPRHRDDGELDITGGNR